MKILVTNDDGIQAEGLKTLVEFAKTLGEVTVCAPTCQQSAKSHAINVHDPFEIKIVDYCDGVTAYSVSSTPVDCVRFGMIGLNAEYDLVLSGVNNGYNIGEDILYSGTVGCVFEAALHNTRAIAFSTEHGNSGKVLQYVKQAYKYICDNKLFDYCLAYNVNIPEVVSGDVRITKQGGAYFTDEFIKVDEHQFDQRGYCVYRYGQDLTLDTDATMNGYISVTPLTVKRDDEKAYERIIGKKRNE